MASWVVCLAHRIEVSLCETKPMASWVVYGGKPDDRPSSRNPSAHPSGGSHQIRLTKQGERETLILYKPSAPSVTLPPRNPDSPQAVASPRRHRLSRASGQEIGR